MVKKNLRPWRRIRRLLFYLFLLLALLSVLPVVLFRWIDPPTSMVIWQRERAENAPQTQSWVDLEQISPHMAVAVIAAEDQKFSDHRGFDTGSMWNAIEQGLAGKRLRGASTLTQQVAKNLFLWQGRSLLRKGMEAWFTVLLEAIWPKQRILEVYLNIAETGPRAFGVAAAAQRYYGTRAARLTAAQAALIAAVLPNPVKYSVTAPSEHVRQRQRWILRQMRNLGGRKYLEKL